MYFKIKKLLATLLVISMVFTSSAFSVLAEGVQNIVEQSTEASVVSSEEQSEEQTKDITLVGSNPAVGSELVDDSKPVEVSTSTSEKPNEPAVEEADTIKKGVATKSEASDDEDNEEESINPEDIEEPEEDSTTISLGVNFKTPKEVVASESDASENDLTILEEEVNNKDSISTLSEINLEQDTNLFGANETVTFCYYNTTKIYSYGTYMPHQDLEQTVDEVVNNCYTGFDGFYVVFGWENYVENYNTDFNVSRTAITPDYTVDSLKTYLNNWKSNPIPETYVFACYGGNKYKLAYDINPVQSGWPMYYDSLRNENGDITGPPPESFTFLDETTSTFETPLTVDDSFRTAVMHEEDLGNHKIIGWNTKSDGTGTMYQGRQMITAPNSDFDTTNWTLTLYAIWEQADLVKYKTSYDKNFPTDTTYDFTSAVDWDTKFPNQEFHLANTTREIQEKPLVHNGENVMIYGTLAGVRKDKEIVGWNTKADGSGTTFSFTDRVQNYTDDFDLNDNLKLYAMWGDVNICKVSYQQNLPTTGTWAFVDTRISRQTDWDTDFAAQTSKLDGNVLKTPISVRGNFLDGNVMIQDITTDPPSMKRIISWKALDTTGDNFAINQTLNTLNPSFDADKELKLYAVWEDVPVYKFYMLYKDGLNKEVAYVYTYDLTTYFNTILDGITGVDGYVNYGVWDGTKTEDQLKSEYDASYVDGQSYMTKAQVVSFYNNWLSNPTSSPIFHMKYKLKHFYLGYTKNGGTKEVKTEEDWNDIDTALSRITYAKFKGWHVITPTDNTYDAAHVLSAYNYNTANTLTTDQLKTEFTNWSSNMNTNKAFGATTSPLSSIAVKTGTTLKTAYTLNETLSVDNLVIIPTYEDGTTGADIPYSTPEFEITPAVGTALTLAHNNTNVTVKYGPDGNKKTCTYTITVTEKQIDSIAVKDGLIADESIKTQYIEGQKISPTNLVITVTYDDATTADIPYAGNESAFSFSLAGNTINISTYELATTDAGDVTITYAGKTCTYPITVAAKQVSSIAVKPNTPPATTYYEGDPLDVTGLILNVTYDNGKTEEVPYDGNEGDFTLDPNDGTFLYTTDTSVSVTYGTKNTSFAITVNPIVITSITVKNNTPTNRTFIEGQNLDVSGLVIIATKNHGPSEEITYAGHEASFTLNPANGSALALGTSQVSVTYSDGTNSFNTTYPLTVNAKQVTSIALAPAPTKTTYFTGETLDVTGLSITVNYDNGTSEPVAYLGNENKFTFNPSLTTALATTHTGNVSVIYGGKSDTYAITVNDPDPTVDRVLESISVSIPPTKVVYNKGEALDPTGLMITANYSLDPLTEDVSYAGNEARFVFTPALGTGLTSGNITLMYNGKQTTFAVTVNVPVPYTPPSGGGIAPRGTTGGGGSGFSLANDIKLDVDQVVVKLHNPPVSGQKFIVSKSYKMNEQYIWQRKANTWSLVDSLTGKALTGWALVEYNGSFDWYHFDLNGLMNTGIYNENGATYYFEYMNKNLEGRMLTGEQNINGSKYVIPLNGRISS